VNLALGKEASVLLANEIRIFHGKRFAKKTFFLRSRNDQTCQTQRQAPKRVIRRFTLFRIMP